MNIKLTKIETKVKDLEDRENKSDLLIVETAKISLDEKVNTILNKLLDKHENI